MSKISILSITLAQGQDLVIQLPDYVSVISHYWQRGSEPIYVGDCDYDTWVASCGTWDNYWKYVDNSSHPFNTAGPLSPGQIDEQEKSVTFSYQTSGAIDLVFKYYFYRKNPNSDLSTSEANHQTIHVTLE